MSDFLLTVTKAFKNLLDCGLMSVEWSSYDASAFGNAVVTLTGTNLLVQMRRDRGETFADAASRQEPDNWFPLQRVVRAVGVSSAPEGLLLPEQAAAIVEQSLGALEMGLGNGQFNQTKTVLAELERVAVKRLMERVGGPRKRL